MQIIYEGFQGDRLVVSLSLAANETSATLVVDGIARGGKFLPSIFGLLYQHTDGAWGLPGLGYANHQIVTRCLTTIVTPAVAAQTPVPNATLAGMRLALDYHDLLPLAYNAGFITADMLLPAIGVCVVESGLYSQARGWHPDQGFHPATDVIGVTGPSAAWNLDHSAQGHADRGLWQFSSKWHPEITDAMADTPTIAAQQAFRVSANGTNFTPWAAFAGLAQAHYDQALQGYPAIRPAVTAFLSTK